MWMPTRCLAHQTCGGNCKNNYHEVMEIIFLVFHLFRQNHCYKAHCHKIIKKLYREFVLSLSLEPSVMSTMYLGRIFSCPDHPDHPELPPPTTTTLTTMFLHPNHPYHPYHPYHHYYPYHPYQPYQLDHPDLPDPVPNQKGVKIVMSGQFHTLVIGCL